ncbi:hypothetical protein QQS21_006850 [Conoideocrella luteorostrata]|uniref:Alpha/beta hydrolase fold-3 domain-containing protein n=1 Tax=Conoideocrella luteorostrata TaxID=1105319 RepID=A0AAJ0FZX5_9HYPO|nr:hypothetical protein QQS21_006850 [Conoideocrella luteorostrata]
MNKLNTTSVSLAVTPTVVSTLFSHFLNRKPLRERPTAHLSYDEGLHLIRSFLDFASHHTVEELQAFTSQWVPNPQWIRVETVKIADEYRSRSAELLQAQLGVDGIAQVGGRQWWQWRKPKSTLEAEWIEMKAHYNARKAIDDPGRRVMLYVHGGAYFFGSVDEHRYQMQRHARKLKARVFAPKYRLAPQFPFPCGLQDCLAAYLYLLSVQDPGTIVLAGDSAGGGMVMSMLCVLRDQGIPLPAGGILLSPWVDLTHSFPSVGSDAPFDYIPQSGFHHKPSRAWPPPNDDDVAMLRSEADKQTIKAKKATESSAAEKQSNGANVEREKAVDAENLGDLPGKDTGTTKHLSVTVDGKPLTIKDQIQMYTTNALLNHPLVSPVMQTTLGGLPPLLIMVGGGEILRDEQIYLAHKCADPAKYSPPLESLSEKEREQLQKYKPTDVQLQVWDDLCHVAPTLSFTRPAKFMYRSVAQFGAWALARAQKRGIEILDDDDISVISSSASERDTTENDQLHADEKRQIEDAGPGQVGKAGDSLPPFKKHMIRQRVTRHGITIPLAQEAELPGCCMNVSDIGVVKEGTVKRWLGTRSQWDQRYSSAKTKVHKKIIKDMVTGFQDFGSDENPPPTALAGRRLINADMVEKKKKTKSMGLALWSFWGSKHDELTVEREQEADKTPEAQDVTGDEGRGARSYQDIKSQQPAAPKTTIETRSRSRRRTVVDENQTDDLLLNKNTPVAQLIERRKEQEADHPGLLSPNYVPETGVAGKRPFIDGIALPFSLKKDAETASMVTLNSAVNPAPGSRPLSQLGSRVEVSGLPASDDVARADELLAAGTTRPAIESFLSADGKQTQAKELGKNEEAAVSK